MRFEPSGDLETPYEFEQVVVGLSLIHISLINNNMEVTTDYIYDNIVVDGREMCSYNNVVFVYVGDKKYLVNGNGDVYKRQSLFCM